MMVPPEQQGGQETNLGQNPTDIDIPQQSDSGMDLGQI